MTVPGFDIGVSRVYDCRLYADSEILKHPFGTVLVKIDSNVEGTAASVGGTVPVVVVHGGGMVPGVMGVGHGADPSGTPCTVSGCHC